MNSKFGAISLLLIAEMAAMSLWFVSAAVHPDMTREVALSPFRQAALSSGVQIGFVFGALISAIAGLADRYDPRRIFAASAICARICNALLLVFEPGSMGAILARFLKGALLAGVYPIGMKMAVGWGEKDRGFLVGALVGALTLGSAFPHLLSVAGGANWRMTVLIASMCSVRSGLASMAVALGPHHSIAPKFDPSVIVSAWTNRRVRLAYAGYLGHMWELYAMWAWIATAVAISYKSCMEASDAEQLSKITAFVAIGSGGLTCAFAGVLADRIGKAEVTILAMFLSGVAALAVAATFGGPPWLTFALVVLWGIFIIPDSAQFSALVADSSRPDQAGSLMTFQTALGFSLTFVTVQVIPVLVEKCDWPLVLAGLAIGPAFGIAAMWRLRSMTQVSE